MASDGRPGFVGREPELEQLEDYLAAAIGGHGQVVLVAGEAGIGKTFLIERFLALTAENHPEVRLAQGQCSERFGQGEGYLPFIEALSMLLAVVGHNGASSSAPYRLDAEITVGQGIPTCAISLPHRPGDEMAPLLVTQTPQTLILVNKRRLDAAYGEASTTALIDRLTALARHETVQGMIMPVENDPAVAEASSAWDANACDPEAANDVTQAIKGVVDEALGGHPSLKYMVIVGSDEIIPFRRVPDGVAISNERAYRRRAGVARQTPLYYALAEGYTLSDDFYADRTPFAWFGRDLYLPDYPIGRLVETPEEIGKLIDVYLASGGEVNAETGLVVGYDFLTDSSLAIKGTLESQGIATSSLISDAWTADELRQELLTSRHDLNSINAHFEHWRAWPADLNSGQLTSADVIGASADLSSILLFSVGCHAGLNVHDAWGETGNVLDFSQVFARHGATWVANTAYGYGMDDAVALSERLMDYFVEELGRGERVAVGQALVRAKQHYINSTAAASLGLYDEKILVEATLFGLPMFTVNVPSPGSASASSQESQTSYTASELQTSQNASRRTVTITPAFSEVTTTAGTYFAANGEVQANGGRPIQPRLSLDIGEPSAPTRGVLFVGADYTDIKGFDPVIARPVTDTAQTEPVFVYEGWYPPQVATVNRVKLDTGILERLVVTPAQYASSGTERLYDSLTYEVYYSTDEDETAPTIWLVEAGRVRGRASFRVDVTDNSEIERVVVAYSLRDGRWRSFDLAYDQESDRWAGELALAAGETVGYFVQAVDMAGNVATSNNKGLFFEPVTYEVHLPLVMRIH